MKIIYYVIIFFIYVFVFNLYKNISAKKESNRFHYTFYHLKRPVFSKPHKHLLLGLYCMKDYSFCKINSRNFTYDGPT